MGLSVRIFRAVRSRRRRANKVGSEFNFLSFLAQRMRARIFKCLYVQLTYTIRAKPIKYANSCVGKLS